MPYGIFTTEHKPEVDQRPLVFLKSVGVLEPVAGHGQALEFTAPRMNSVVVNLYEEAQEPFNANLWTKRRHLQQAWPMSFALGLARRHECQCWLESLMQAKA